MLLMALGLVAGFLLGILVAVTQVRNRGAALDKMLGGISLTFFAVPDFWLALIMLALFAYWLPVFPIGGAIDPVMHDVLSPAGRAWDRVRHVILPASTLALLYFPVIARFQRAALLEALPSDYVTTARAKGVSERVLVRHHALRNALLPIVTLVGVAFPALLTGAVFIERVFSWPGMGWVIVNAINSRDYPLITACVILGSAFVVAGSILADALYRLLDPRLRDER
jgi:peptide/nickel transport system permease protein